MATQITNGSVTVTVQDESVPVWTALGWTVATGQTQVVVAPSGSVLDLVWTDQYDLCGTLGTNWTTHSLPPIAVRAGIPFTLIYTSGLFYTGGTAAVGMYNVDVRFINSSSAAVGTNASGFNFRHRFRLGTVGDSYGATVTYEVPMEPLAADDLFQVQSAASQNGSSACTLGQVGLQVFKAVAQ